MAANFLGFFGKKKEEAPAQQPSPLTAAPSVSAIPSLSPSSTSFAPGRKRVTQRLSLKGLQSAQKGAPDHSKIQLPGAAMSAPAPLIQPVQVDGTVDVPFSVILTAIPEQLLTADYATLLAAPEARVEIGLPLANVLGMLPSGKLEFSISELTQLVPEGFIHSLENIPDYAGTPIVLPLGLVVSRIPPHMMTLRSDQRPIDSSVLSMQDPFSKEALEKAQAEAAAKVAEAAAAQIEQEAIPELLAEEPLPAETNPDASEPVDMAPAVPGFDAELLAAAEAAMAAEKAAEAGVELPTNEDYPAIVTEYGFEEPATFLESLPEGAASVVEGEMPQEEVLEVDPALVEWARNQADQAEALEQNTQAPPDEPVQEESSSFASSEAFRSFLEQVDSDVAEVPKPVESAAPDSFEPASTASFDALNAPTRPIVKPKSPPQPPVIKGFGSFKTEPKPEVSGSFVETPAQFAAVEGHSATSQPLETSPLSVSPTQTASDSAGLQGQRVRLSPTINKYLGLDEHSEISFQDIMNQVRSWPGVSGCVIAGKDGLPISAVVDDLAFSKSLSAFAPKIVSRVSELFVDLGMPEVQEIHVPMDDVSTFLFMEGGVYFIVLYKDASMPHWYRKVIKAVLEEIGSKQK